MKMECEAFLSSREESLKDRIDTKCAKLSDEDGVTSRQIPSGEEAYLCSNKKDTIVDDANKSLDSTKMASVSSSSSLEEFREQRNIKKVLATKEHRNDSEENSSPCSQSELCCNDQQVSHSATPPLHSINSNSQPFLDPVAQHASTPLDTATSGSQLTLSAFRKPQFAVRLTKSSPEKILEDDYDLTCGATGPRILGHGASSTVRMAVHKKSGNKVAIKCILKHEILRTLSHRGTRKSTLDEYEILSTFSGSNRHKNIIDLIDVYETDSEIHLVLQYCAGGELFDAIQRRRGTRKSESIMDIFSTPRMTDSEKNSSSKWSATAYSEAQAAKIATQLISALAFLHERNVVHRDVKPENILLLSDDEDNLSVKLSDFGCARILHDITSDDQNTVRSRLYSLIHSPLTPPNKNRSRAYSRVGSDYYAAPEMSSCGENGYDAAVDMFSLGVTLYILLSGEPPASRPRCGSFVLDDDSIDSSDEDDSSYEPGSQDACKDPFKSSLSNVVDFPHRNWKNISSSAKDLVRRMLNQDPDKRIKAAEALKHDWILLHKNDTQSDIRNTRTREAPKPLRFSFLDDHILSVTAPDTSLNFSIPSSSQLLPISPLTVSESQELPLSYLATKLYEAQKVSSSEKKRKKRHRGSKSGKHVQHVTFSDSASKTPKKRKQCESIGDIRIPAPQNVFAKHSTKV